MRDCISDFLLSKFPEGFDPSQLLWLAITVIGVISLTGIVIKIFFKTATAYLHALSSAMAIIFFYMFSILLCPVLPEIFGKVLELLPLVDVTAEGVTIHTLQFGLRHWGDLSREFLPVLVFSGILILLDDWIPDARNTFGWIVMQFGIVCASCGFYWIATWVIEKLLRTFQLDFLGQCAPIILFCVLFIFVALGVMKVILALLISSVSPLLGAISAWFATDKLGVRLGKAVLCAIIVCAAAVVLTTMGMGTILFANICVLIFLFYMILLLALWIFTGHFL